MLIIFGIISLLSFVTFQVEAQKISQSFAIDVAKKWISQKSSNTIFTPVLKDSLSYNDLASIYCFDLDPHGFIWISANMQFAPVLGYSFEKSDSHLDKNSPAYSFLQTYQDEAIEFLSSTNSSALPHPGWNTLNVNTRFKGFKTDNVVEPMMEVTWGQGEGYNTYTPDNTPTGCVAVAMVQMMRHWEWPPKGQGEHSYTHDEYGDFAVNFDTIDFNWSSLPLNSPTPEIAKIMLYGGIALHMNYAPGGSGASVERIKNLLFTNFRYNETRIRYSSMADVGTQQNWIRILKNELINGRPIIVRGSGTGGHAFNFDGFVGDYFHVNWGWSGSSNGYFLVSSLTPGSSNFSESQGAVMGIFPDTLMMWDRPYGVRALASDAKVTLAWDGIYNSELSYYNIYRNGEVIGQTPQRNYTDTTAQNGQVYEFSVSALYSTDTADYESDLTSEVILEPAAGFALPLEQNFEEGHPGWQISGSSLGFIWGTAADLGMGSDTLDHFIGINSGVAGNNVLVSDYLISNGLDLSEVNLALLSFDYVLKKWQDIDHLYLMYRVFEDNEWIEFEELEATKGYDDWVNFKTYIPQAALKNNVQLAFYYTDNAGVGYGAGIDNIQVMQVSNPGIPEFTISVNETCMGTEVIFTDQSEGTRDSYSWNFGLGANPRYAETAGPHIVTYKSSGAKSIQLILNELDELVRDDALTIVRPPAARFGKSINYKTVSFNNTSSNATAYMWDFGDGIKVTMEDPIHVYALSGDYQVQLIAINHICENDTTQQLVSIKVTGLEEIDVEESLNLYPNPANNVLNISLASPIQGEIIISVFSIQGKRVIEKTLDQGVALQSIKLDISQLETGSYFIQLSYQNQVFNRQFIKQF